MGIAIHKPPIFDGKDATYKNGDEWGMVYYCYANIIGVPILPKGKKQFYLVLLIHLGYMIYFDMPYLKLH